MKKTNSMMQLKSKTHSSILHPEAFFSPCIVTPDLLHAAMRPDMIADTEVEISTEDCCEEEEEEDEEIGTMLEDPEPDHEPVRKRRGRDQHLAVFGLLKFIYEGSLHYFKVVEKALGQNGAQALEKGNNICFY